MRLNQEQQKARDHGEGACVISAGPGSGKTEVAAQRFVVLVESGVRPEHIVFVTFTNRAGDEMRVRVCSKLGGMAPKGLWIGTFHGICVRLLKRIAPEYLDGRTGKFTVCDDGMSRSILSEILGQLFDTKKHKLKPSDVLKWIERNKRRMVSIENVEASDERDDVKLKAWKIYEQRLREQNAFDYSDLLLVTTRLAESATRVGGWLRGMFKHVMVDEYQDTDLLQFRLVQALGAAGNITVVGDVDQSIYSFRGALPGNIRSFEEANPGCRVIRLQTNYRSTGAIVDFCNDLISSNTMRDPKVMRSSGGRGDPPIVMRFSDGLAESSEVVRRVRGLLDNGVDAGQIGIMYRQHKLSRAIEYALRDAGVNYQMVRGTPFYGREEVMDLLCFFHLFVHEGTDHHFRRAARQYPNLGKKTVDKFVADATDRGISPVRAAIMTSKGARPQSARHASMAKFGELLDEGIERVAAQQPLVELGDWTMRQAGVLSRYRQKLESASQVGRKEEEKAMERLQNLGEVLSAMQAHVDRLVADGERPALGTYLDEAALCTQGDEVAGDQVTLLTIHAAKGLQFDAVFVIGVDQGICPPDKPMQATEREEERRCLYVAASRAKRFLVLSSAAERYLWGVRSLHEPSEFLAQVDEALYRYEDARPSFVR